MLKERLIVNELKRFVTEAGDYRILILVGIRRIGKTTALLQLKDFIKDSTYINFAEVGAEDKLAEFMENPKKLLLLDEISFLRGYPTDIMHIEQQAMDCDYKVIITGSSPTHTLSLYGGPLGGGRATMRRLPLLTFTEYLYFSDRIRSYDCEYNPTEADFIDYLNLKDVPDGLRITFDEAYFRTFYSDVELSNRNTTLVRDNIRVDEEHLTAICDLLAYKLQLNVNYDTLIKPDIVAREIPSKKERLVLDFSDTLLFDSSAKYSKLSPEKKATALHFMVKSGLAYVDIPYDKVNNRRVADMFYLLESVSTAQDLIDIFNDFNICPMSPLMYTRLAEDILRKVDLSVGELLEQPKVRGIMLESYIKGTMAYQNGAWNLTSYKIAEGSDEVDLIDTKSGLLCEITVSNKRLRDVNLNKHFPNEPYLRVLSTKDIEDFVDGIHRVPYPKLCMMFDLGTVCELKKNL